MQGDGAGQGGIIQSILSDIFRFSKQGDHTTRNFIINASFVEVYNEHVRDLLADNVGDNISQGTPGGDSFTFTTPDVQILTGASGEVVMDCITKQIQTVEEALEVLSIGNANRIVAKTDANIHSSRSHAIFRINVQSTSRDVGPGAEVLRLSDFYLVDLAGSETASNVGSNLSRQKERTKINQR